jgi:hypothetical protein
MLGALGGCAMLKFLEPQTHLDEETFLICVEAHIAQRPSLAGRLLTDAEDGYRSQVR